MAYTLTGISNLSDSLWCVDKLDFICLQAGALSAAGLETQSSPKTDRAKHQPKPSKNRDMDGRRPQQYLGGLGSIDSKKKDCFHQFGEKP